MNRIVSEGRLTTILVVLVLSALGLQAQTRISGVVNQYVQVTEVVPCDSLVRVGNPTNFLPGDRVLLIQMERTYVCCYEVSGGSRNRMLGESDSSAGLVATLRWSGLTSAATASGGTSGT